MSTQSLQHTASSASSGETSSPPIISVCKRLGMPSSALMACRRLASVDQCGRTHRSSGPASPWTDTCIPSSTIPLEHWFAQALRRPYACIAATHMRCHKISSHNGEGRAQTNSSTRNATPVRPRMVAGTAASAMMCFSTAPPSVARLTDFQYIALPLRRWRCNGIARLLSAPRVVRYFIGIRDIMDT